MNDRMDNPIELYRSILNFLEESTDDYFFVWDFQTQKLYLSPRIRDNYDIMGDGRTYTEMDAWCRLVYPWDRPLVEETLRKIAGGEITTHSMDYRVVNRAGEIVWINCRGKSQLDEQGRALWMIGRVTDAPMEGRGDRLTGALDMDSLKEEIEGVLAGQRDGFLLLVGVDELKSINLKNGRAFGDGVLKRVVQSLEDAVSGACRIYRVNGDCFAVNLLDMEEREVEAIFLQTQKRMEGLCTLSGGCVSYRRYRVLDGEAMYQYAENALYYAKARGRSGLWFFSPEDYEKELAALELREDLRESAAEGFAGFTLAYQPQVLTGSYDIYGAEALLRYASPRRGQVSPGEFIPILEQSGLMCAVGRWALRTALEQCRRWRERMPDFHISVNMSCAQLSQEGITQYVIQELGRVGLPGRALTIEVTESMQLFDYPQINEIFRRWKQHGIQISVDDFGTGYSGLRQLKELEVDEIKIDRCFVSGIQHSAYNYRLIGNILDLADSSKIRVCCEGVETEEELTVLEELHPKLYQGFLFSRPCTVQQLEDRFLDPEAQEFRMRAERVAEYRSKCHPASGLAGEEGLSEQELVQAIMESEDNIFYVSDPETYELYYLNPAGKKLFGVRDYHGKKCYKVLQGREEPCTFCTNCRLHQEDFYVWDHRNEYCGRHFVLKDKLMVYKGRRLRLEVALDITSHEVVSQNMRERLDFAEKVVDYTRILANNSDFSQAVQSVLASVGEFYRADRAYLFQPDGEYEDHWNNTFEWCDKNVAPQQENLQRVPPKTMVRWLKLFDRDESVIVWNLDPLREKSYEEWRTLEAQGIQRLIAVPLRDGGRTVGFIGVDNPRYSIQDDSQVRVLSYFLVNRLGQERNERRFRTLLQENYRDILSQLGVGLWIIRLDGQRRRGEMVADDAMLRIMGLEGHPDPETCYQFWYSRISDGYYRYVNQGIDSMVESGQIVQIEYTWRHPQQGEVQVRCAGLCVSRDENGVASLRGYHYPISGLNRPRSIQELHQQDVFEFNELNKTVFFHTRRVLLAGEAVHETNFPQSWIDSEMVHPHFAAEFRELFSRLRLKQEENMELRLKSKDESYQWFRLSLRHLSQEGQDADTVVVVVEPTSQERKMELEYIRVHRYYQALLSEAIAYAEVDLESGQLQSIGGVWADYAENEAQRAEPFQEALKKHLGQYMSPEETQRLDDYCSPNSWNRLFEREELRQSFCYQRPVEGELRWVELVIHIFREEVTRNVYALAYLKDVTAVKERELAQAEAAKRDPLTNIYNRNAFAGEVERHVMGPGGCGVLLLLDIDNFKEINDRMGHLAGDQALKRVSQLLENTFRKQDIIGRMGGDEFLVFIKGRVERQGLEERLSRLLGTLHQETDIPLTISIGVTFVEQKDFDYEYALHQADMALYQSKKNGKNNFTFL